jgi:hypothetical protein
MPVPAAGWGLLAPGSCPDLDLHFL